MKPKLTYDEIVRLKHMAVKAHDFDLAAKLREIELHTRKEKSTVPSELSKWIETNSPTRTIL